jgi:transposase
MVTLAFGSMTLPGFCTHLFSREDGQAMPSKYDEATKAKAVRLVVEHRDDYDSEWAAMKAVSSRLGMTTETLRKRVRQAAVDSGEAEGVQPRRPGTIRERKRGAR